VNLDCDDPFPNNEPNVVVDPADPQHAIVSSNDYGSCCDEYYTTFDGGRSWVTGNMSTRGPNVTGSDPITVIDPVHGTAVHFSLNYHVSSGIPAVNGDVVASVSTDGGRSWQVPVVSGTVAAPRCSSTRRARPSTVYPASPHYGRIYLTWTGFGGDAKRSQRSPIVSASSDDGGRTWTVPARDLRLERRAVHLPDLWSGGGVRRGPVLLPGRDPGRRGPRRVPERPARGRVGAGEQFESQYFVVTSTDGGQTFAAPVHVADQEDGTVTSR
jgi:Neuraminidase (sialidase)